MSGSRTKHWPKRASSDLRTSVYSGVVVALLVVVAGAFFALTSSSRWTAQASIVVLPSSSLGPAEESAYYDYLSRGQIVATFAEVGNNVRSLQDAQAKIGMNEADQAKSSVTLSVVPNTSVVLVLATARTSHQAGALADATTELARTYFDRLAVPFRTQVVADATGAAKRTGPTKALILIATLVAALVAGIAMQQATLAILRARRGQAEVAPAELPAATGSRQNGSRWARDGDLR